MKKSTFVFSVMAVLGAVALSASCTTGAKGTVSEADSLAVNGPSKGAIVYFNLDKVMEQYDMANDLRSKVQSKADGIQADLKRRGDKLQRDMNTFNDKINKGLLLQSVANEQAQALQKRQAEFQNYQAQKSQEMQEEAIVMQNQIADAIKTFLDNYNEEKGFAMILTTQGDLLPIPVATADASLDITEDVIKGLNEEYVKVKAENKSAESKK